ncbi:MAG: DUF87 domain-containing protein [Bryobacteraceae bacterium]|nr:DUF87 domain-containing protein [Bryobacteraceae bacterium]
MIDYEKLGVFYLGRPYDPIAGQPKPGLLLYDSKDLVTHAACFGMTGSGKTGLCTVLLEEAAIDGIPAIVVDPKGDLGNLMLTFPDLDLRDFAPWIPDDAPRRKGVTPEVYAAQQAETWRAGLARWDQDASRIRRLREAADFCIYTPGSEAGRQVSLLRSFDAPPPQVLDDRELLRERIQATATSLLGLLGIDADPARSREHILLSLILDSAWKQRRNIELAGLIGEIQNPPASRVGVLDLETFYPARERFSLAMTLNNVLASPGFEAWLAGEPLDIDRMLYTETAKPRVSIFSIAHLNDAERMFFVSMLLNHTVSWMRKQPGATSLRALFYMDEVAGYLPPVANPPSKPPMMTLLKQGRAFGLGVALATQNPVDIDYKALGNAGTWFIGRLQTERDQARVLDGLAGAVAATGAPFNRPAMERTLAGLGKRIFLMYNVHEDVPETFETRWALSYLAGPLTRAQIRLLSQASPAKPDDAAAAPFQGSRQPVLPPEIPQCFLPVRSHAPASARLSYEPVLAGFASIRFVNAAARYDHRQELGFEAPIREENPAVGWDSASPLPLEVNELESAPRPDADFAPLPRAALLPKNYADWSRGFVQWLADTQTATLYRSAALKQSSNPGESERDFRIRLELASREERDRAVEALRQKYAPKFRVLEEKIRRAEAAVQREQLQARQSKLESTVSIGATLLGALLGRRVISSSTVSRAGGAVRSMGKAQREAADVERAGDTLEACRRQLADLQSEFASETALIESRVDPRTQPLEAMEVRARKTDISIKLLSLAWKPYWRDPRGVRTAA